MGFDEDDDAIINETCKFSFLFSILRYSHLFDDKLSIAHSQHPKSAAMGVYVCVTFDTELVEWKERKMNKKEITDENE